MKIKTINGLSILMMLSLAFFVAIMPTQAAAAPYISYITPTKHAAETFDLYIYGSGFASNAIDQVYWYKDGHYVGRGTVLSCSSTKLVVREYMTGAQLGTYTVAVKNPSTGQVSNRKAFILIQWD